MEPNIYDLPDTAARPSYSQLQLANALVLWNQQNGGITDWLKKNSTAVYIASGVLLVMALFSVGRGR